MTTKEVILQMERLGQGALGRARLDEPVFVLRAKDCLAPKVIEYWADLISYEKGNVPEKARQARAIAHDMRAWQERNTCKLPD